MTYLKTLFIFLLSITMLSCANQQVKVEPGISIELAEYRKATISDINYNLTFNIPGEQDQPIKGSEIITLTLSDVSQPLQLDFRESPDKITSVSTNGKDGYDFEQEHVIISSEHLIVGENTIEIEFTAGETSLNRNPDYLYTLFVPDRARTAFPVFDQPSLKATYELTLIVPESWEAMANAPLSNTNINDGIKELRYAKSDLISTYLFSFVAGKFERVTRTIDGREMSMLHRETDEEKVERNLDDIFQLHATSLEWLEEYSGIDYPFQKFDFVLIPSFQYGGMEHVGAIQYRASSLFLDKSPSQSQLLGRASLIAHETAHMWFGDLVTMDWFNDVWTKEVFANFMAAKIMNPSFPDVNHDLNFLVRHYPSSYSVDRTEGANPIRQELPNLNEAGTMYGAIIYNKAPIMMRQLESLIGEDAFREGMREYLTTYSFKNATWPDLIDILDKRSDENLAQWSHVWVNTPGRPHFSTLATNLVQNDPSGENRVWPQEFDLSFDKETVSYSQTVNSTNKETTYEPENDPTYKVLFNSNGYGYGLFPIDDGVLVNWDKLDEIKRGTLLITLYENMLEGNAVKPSDYIQTLQDIVTTEENQLVLNLALGQLNRVYWSFLTPSERNLITPELEEKLWEAVRNESQSSRKKIYFNSYRNIGQSPEALDRLERIWSRKMVVEGLILSENDFIGLATNLAIKKPEQSDEIVSTQLEKIKNADRKRRFEWIKPTLSNDSKVRDEFFQSLKDEKNREIESWVGGALGILHHPLRTAESEKYILESLELVEEIQRTGDIFFPSRWLGGTLGNHTSPTAKKIVRDFLEERPDYNKQLRMKILQSADMLFRADRILNATN